MPTVPATAHERLHRKAEFVVGESGKIYAYFTVDGTPTTPDEYQLIVKPPHSNEVDLTNLIEEESEGTLVANILFDDVGKWQWRWEGRDTEGEYTTIAQGDQYVNSTSF